jgi:hypothetical protein
VARTHFLPWSSRSFSSGKPRGKNPETAEVMAPIRELCKRLHLRCERNPVGLARDFDISQRVLRMHSAGTWDLVVYLPDAGCAVMVECKMPGEELTQEQAEWGRLYRACGIETVVATSPQQFLDEIEAIRKRKAAPTADILKKERAVSA